MQHTKTGSSLHLTIATNPVLLHWVITFSQVLSILIRHICRIANLIRPIAIAILSKYLQNSKLYFTEHSLV